MHDWLGLAPNAAFARVRRGQHVTICCANFAPMSATNCTRGKIVALMRLHRPQPDQASDHSEARGDLRQTQSDDVYLILGQAESN